MNTFEAIAARRSIRGFQDKPVPRALIEQVLQAAVQAPSGKNRQPWRFVVVEGRVHAGLRRDTSRPCTFLSCEDRSKAPDKYEEWPV